jgi:hypothetical protein
LSYCLGMKTTANEIDARGETLEQHRVKHLARGSATTNLDGHPAVIGRGRANAKARKFTWGIRFVPVDRGIETFEDGSRFEPVAAV